MYRFIAAIRSQSTIDFKLQLRSVDVLSDAALRALEHVRQHADGFYRWKFDHYQRARAPYRLSSDEHAALWSRITCPTLLMWGEESFLSDPETAGLLAHFKHAELQKIAGAGHWLHHDRLDVVLTSLQRFLDFWHAVKWLDLSAEHEKALGAALDGAFGPPFAVLAGLQAPVRPAGLTEEALRLLQSAYQARPDAEIAAHSVMATTPRKFPCRAILTIICPA